METGNENNPDVFKCDICNEAEFDTLQKLNAHKHFCQKKKDKEQEQTQEDRRQERVPFGVPEQRFTDLPDDGFHYRVFNDNWRKEPGRVQRAQRAGYEVVEHPQSGKTVGTNEDGTEIKGVLMRIPQELWEQDQAAKEGRRAVVDEQIYQGQHTARRGDGRYVPNEGIRMENKLTP